MKPPSTTLPRFHVTPCPMCWGQGWIGHLPVRRVGQDAAAAGPMLRVECRECWGRGYVSVPTR